MSTVYNVWAEVFQYESIEVSVCGLFANSGAVWFLWPYQLAADAHRGWGELAVSHFRNPVM